MITVRSFAPTESDLSATLPCTPPVSCVRPRADSCVRPRADSGEDPFVLALELHVQACAAQDRARLRAQRDRRNTLLGWCVAAGLTAWGLGFALGSLIQ